MAHLVIIRGLPGSGKSTFAKMLDRPYFEADQYFVDTAGNYVFDPTRIGAAHKWCLERVQDSLEGGWDTVVSNTFTQHWEMLPYIQYCNRNGHTFSVIKCEGNYGSIHDVPEAAIQRMRDRWEDY